MPETKETDSKKPLSLTRPGRLELKKTVDAGMVKQSFSHGRSKQVSVEVMKLKTFTRGEKTGEMTESEGGIVSPFGGGSHGGDLGREAHHALSDAEKHARMRALEDAKARHEAHTPAEIKALEARVAEIEEAPKSVPQPVVEAPAEEPPPPTPVEIEAKAPVEETAAPVEEAKPRRAPAVDAEQQVREQALDAERVRQDELARSLAAQHVGGRLVVKVQAPAGSEETGTATTLEAPTTAPPTTTVEEEDEDEAKAKRGRQKKTPAVSPKPTERRRGKLTINQAIDEGEGIQRVRSVAAFRRAREKEKRKAHAEQQPQERKKVSREVVLPETISVQELANRMAEKGADVV